MKKFLKILAVILLVLIVLVFAVPVVFKGKIVEIANEQLKKNLRADASFADISISLIRNFPNLSISLEGLNILGIDDFEGDTLASIASFDVAVNLVSAIKMENIEIKRIIIDQPYLNAIVLQDGMANWDIVPEGDSIPEETPDTAASEFDTKIALKLFQINQAKIRYTDHSSNMRASLENFNFSLSGDLGQDFSTIQINSETEKLNFIMDGIPYLKNVLLKMNFDVDANLKESIYKLNQNSVSLNALTLNFDGSIEMPESGDIITNVNFGTSNTDFKTLLSLIPAIYMSDFAELETTGKLKLDGKVSGALTENTTPSADLVLKVSNASFSYPDLPKTVEDVQIDLNVHYDGVQMDNTVVDLNKFHLNMGGNPVDMTLNLRNPESDPFTNGKLVAALDLATITDIIPLEDTELKGKINANLDWMGKLSTIENEQYEDFKANGRISITNLYYNSPDVPKAFIINQSSMSFSPQYMAITNFDAKLGQSDFKIAGRLSNYIPFLLSDGTVEGELTLNANNININELMVEGEETETVTEEADTSSMEVIEVPKNINFAFTSSIAKLKYDKLDLTNLLGVIYIRNGKVILENLSMHALDGTLALSGEYNTQDIKNPLVDFKIDASQIDIPLSFKTFDMLGKIAPIASKATGKVSIGMSFSSLLQQNMKPVLKSIAGDGNLSSKAIGINNASAFSAIGKALKTDALNKMTLNDVDLDFEIQNGSLQVQPFETSMGNLKMIVGGEQTFENTLNYAVNLVAPRSLLGLENPVVNNLYSDASAKGLNIERSETVNMLVNVTGALSDPKVNLNLKENTGNKVEAVKEEIKETAKAAVKEKKEEIKTDTKAKAREEAAKIIEEAEKQAETIRKEGKKSADAIRWEANDKADKLVKEASNPIAKRAAEPAAKKIRDEGEAKAKKIESEADAKANKVVADAKKKADALLK